MKPLDKEEQELMESVEKGEWRSVSNKDEEIELSKAYARATLEKKHQLTFRLTANDLKALKVRAIAEGLTYRALVASIVHKYVSGQLVEQK